MIWPFLIIPLILILIRFILYSYKLKRIKFYFKLYFEYVEHPDFKFHQYKSQIVQLFNDADLSDFSIQRIEPVGYGKLQSFSAKGFDNLTNIDREIIDIITSKFNEAIGVFRFRMLQSINPLFWIEFIFKLPQYLFEFLGVLPDKVIVKVFLILYWLIALIFGLKKFDLFENFLK